MKKIRSGPWSAGLATLIILFAFASPGVAASHLVAADGSGDFPSIAAAISGAAPGDTILLADGVFTGAANKNLDFGGKELVVRSQSGMADACTIDCQGSGRAFRFQSGERQTSVIEAITIARGKLSPGGGIYCTNASGPRIADCTFRDNDGVIQGSAIALSGGSSPWIVNCRFLDNDGSTGTIYGESQVSPVIENCTFSENTAASSGGAIHFYNVADPVIINCLFIGNQSGGSSAIYSQIGSSFVVEGCTFADNVGGTTVLLYIAGLAEFNHCTFAHNRDEFMTIRSYFTLLTLSNTIIAHCGGAAITYDGASVTLSCCDLFGNEGGDWTGGIAGQLGLAGNISSDPLFCDHLSGSYTIAENSLCAPDNNPGCGLIGAWPVDCSPTCTLAFEPRRVVTYAPCLGAIPFELEIDHAVGLGGFDLCTGFDDQKVNFDQVSIDPAFLGSTGRFVQPDGASACAPACQPDGVRFGASTFGLQPGPSGSGRLATVYWQPSGVSAATTDFICPDHWTIENTDTPPATIAVSYAGGAQLLHRPFCYGDFNDNGDVSVLDVMQVGSRWGSESGDAAYAETYDVNLFVPGNYCASIPDGVIDVVDVQSVAARWGRGCAEESPLVGSGGSSGGRAETGAPIAPSSPLTQFRIAPEVVTLSGEIGDAGVFWLEVVDASGLGAFETTVRFDPSVIQVEDVAISPFLGSTGRSVYPLSARIDNEGGAVTMGAWTLGDLPAVSGTGVLAAVTVRIRSCPGQSGLDLDRVVLTDPAGLVQALGAVSGGTVVTQCDLPSSGPEASLPTALALRPGRPNPFGRSTTMVFSVPASAASGLRTELLIVDASGRTVRRLFDGLQEPGVHEIVWDGRDDRGLSVPSGAYFCRLRAGDSVLTRAIVRLR